MSTLQLSTQYKNAHIILFGFKHVGKSIIGEQLARQLHRHFLDIDVIIEQLFEKRFGKKLACREIMQQFGSHIFNDLEHQALVQILHEPPAVIALGGGTALSAANQKLLHPHSLIHLTAPPHVVFNRIMHSGIPAFFPANQDPLVAFYQLWQQRQHVYQRLTPITIYNTNSVQHAVDHILSYLHTGTLPDAVQKQLLLMHGPNLNKLGQRAVEHYGHSTLYDIEQLCRTETVKYDLDLITYQSNHEGALIDTLQTISAQCAGIIINPGAFAHYSYALHDALIDTQLPIVEVHLSAIAEREPWRKISVTSHACIQTISGKKEAGYIEAIQVLVNHLSINAG